MNKRATHCLMLFCALMLVKGSKATVEEALAVLPSSLRIAALV